MRTFLKNTILLITAIVFLSFNVSLKTFEFMYPKRKHTIIALALNADNFGKFSKEWRGKDYYYYSKGKEGMNCSILYYKLSEEERLALVEIPRITFGTSDINPVYPSTYFSTNSNLKDYETNVETWGDLTDDFMFRQSDITEFQGVKMKRKHMYAYCMPDKDLFVQVHLSKPDYTSSDSTVMRQILNSLVKKGNKDRKSEK